MIGNLTRDPELRYTPNGTAVCSFGLATGRSWTTEAGEKREETEFHRIVAWNKLAELCSQFLSKGRKVYVEGRLSTRTWTAADGAQKTTTEIVIDDMILLDFKKPTEEAVRVPVTKVDEPVEESENQEEAKAESDKKGKSPARNENKPTKNQEETTDAVSPDDIPF